MTKHYKIALYAIGPFFLIYLVHAAENSLVLRYDEFGPPAAAYEVIGNDWWQWQSHGDSRPKKYEIKVVVFKGINIDKIKQQFPVIENTQQDFRYLEYQDAINYLDHNIADNLSPDVTIIFKATREKLTNHFFK